MITYAEGLRIMEALMELKTQGLISLEEAMEMAKLSRIKHYEMLYQQL